MKRETTEMTIEVSKQAEVTRKEIQVTKTEQTGMWQSADFYCFISISLIATMLLTFIHRFTFLVGQCLPCKLLQNVF